MMPERLETGGCWIGAGGRKKYLGGDILMSEELGTVEEQ
jgi:hypothetical protein